MRARFNLRPETRGPGADQRLQRSSWSSSTTAPRTTLNLSARYSFLDSEALNFPGGGGRASPASTAARDNADARPRGRAQRAASALSPRRPQRDAPAVGAAVLRLPRRSWPSPPWRSRTCSSWARPPPTWTSTRSRAGRARPASSASSGGHQVKVGVRLQLHRGPGGLEPVLPRPHHLPEPERVPGLHARRVLVAGAARARTHPGFDVPFTDPRARRLAGRRHAVRLRLHAPSASFVQDQWTVTPQAHPQLRRPLRPRELSGPLHRQAGHEQLPAAGRASPTPTAPRASSARASACSTTAWSAASARCSPPPTGRAAATRPTRSVLFPSVARVPRTVPPDHGRRSRRATPAAVNFLTTGRVPAAGATSLTDNMSSELVNPFSYQASAQIAQEIGERVRRLRQLPLRRRPGPARPHRANLNAVQTGTLSTGQADHRRAGSFAELGNFHVTDNLGYSTYHGGTIELQKQFRGGIGFTRVLHAGRGADQRGVRHQPGRLPGRARLLAGGRALAPARAPSRHAFLREPGAEGRGRCCGDFKFAALVTPRERPPLHRVRGRGRQRGRQPQRRPRRARWTATRWKGPSYAQRGRARGARVPAGRRVRGEISVDVFNLFNRTNIRDLNTVWGSFDPDVPPIAASTRRATSSTRARPRSGCG